MILKMQTEARKKRRKMQTKTDQQKRNAQEPFDSYQITTCMLDLGQILLHAGAEVSRVEETMMLIGRAYGFHRVEAYATTNNLIVTVEDKESRVHTQIRRVMSISTDMEKVRACNELSRAICRAPQDADAFRASIEGLKHTAVYSLKQSFAIYMLVAASMSVFFGGDAEDAIAAAAAALLLRLCVYYLGRAGLQNFLTNFFTAFIVGTAIYLLLQLGIGHHYDKISMGNIMLLVSGSGLMTSVRDMMNNDLLSGIMGFLSALIGAAALGLGFVAAGYLFL